jgi:hypothetical protein
MRHETEEWLTQLRDAAWFSAVGRPDVATGAAVLLSTWDEAVHACASLEWQDAKIELSNRIGNLVRNASTERFQHWNEVVRSVKPLVMTLVADRTAFVTAAFKLPQVFLQSVQWDILHSCIEREYLDVCPAGFYSEWARWYVKGHFPCGWSGELTSGRPIIY